MITDEQIGNYLACVFGSSEEGAALHNMVFACVPAAHDTPLGLPGTGQLSVTIYAIAPTEDVDTESFIARTIRGATAEARRKNVVPYFAALGVEAHGVPEDGDEVTENLARRLRADRKLQHHPRAVEVTLLYAACRDGRRWSGEHIITGPRAGTVIGPELVTGARQSWETGIHQRLLRAAVGLA